MKHTVDKGHFFSLLDSRYSSSVDERVAILEAMRAAEGGQDRNVFRDAGTLNPDLLPTAQQRVNANPAARDPATTNTRMKHLYEHWFGYEPDPDQDRVVPSDTPEKLIDWVPESGKARTGWWSHWHGDAFDIFRTTIVRAIEVSLGLAVGADPRRKDGTIKKLRAWPIEFLWICGAPKFEGWISWRRHKESARVLVLMVTPSIGYDPGAGYESGISFSLTPGLGSVSGGADYKLIEDKETTKDRTHGLWVVGHELSALVPEPGLFSCSPTDPDVWLYEDVEKNTGLVVGTGGVVTVQPAEVDGGVREKGRAWT